MLKKSIIIILPFLLAGCGANSSINSDRPSGVSLIDTAVPKLSSVQVTSIGPSVNEGGKALSGSSCRNKVWQPAPTEEVALNQLKLQAEKQGLNAIHSVQYKKEGTSLITNCWATIYATGIGYKLQESLDSDT